MHTRLITNVLIGGITLSLALAGCKKNEKKDAPSQDETATKTEAPAKDETTTEAPAKDEAAAKDAASVGEAETRPEGVVAEAKITAASGSEVAGVVYFSNEGDKVKIEWKLGGLTPGNHGFHVHEKGDCSAPDAKSAGGHFNPRKMDHGAPMDGARHVGDLGNVVADDKGMAEKSLILPKASISLTDGDEHNIIGRAVVVHGGEDDMDSQPSGNAGPRVGCGVITAVAAE